MEKKTFRNMQVLKTAQQTLKSKLGNSYFERVTPYFTILKMVMDANAINEFEALKLIKEKLPIYEKPGAPLFFSAAIIEMTEDKHFVGFVKD